MTAPGSDLEHATRVEGDAGSYHARLSEDWEIWGPNGGYLATIALRAAGMVAQIEQPASFYCHFLSSPSFGAVELTVSALKRGRRAESFAVEMKQQDKPILHALIKTAAQAPGYSHQHLRAPAVPSAADLETYQRQGDSQHPAFSFWNNVERRPVEQSATGEPSEEREPSESPSAPVLREWARFRPRACFEDPFLDAARALILLDTYGFPAAYRKYRSWEYLAPSLDTSVWFHHFNPGCEWLLIDHECTVADHGLMGVSGKVWDTDGRLLATGSAQLCCIPNSQ